MNKSNFEQLKDVIAALRHPVDVRLQSRPPKHGLGRHHAKTAAGHGRVALLLIAPNSGGITLLAERDLEIEVMKEIAAKKW